VTPNDRLGRWFRRWLALVSSFDMHPLCAQSRALSVRDRSAVADDPEGARAEWEGTFRSDLAAFLSDELIDRAIDYDRPLENVRRHDGRSRYRAFVDPSGGRHDAFTLCIGHKDGRGEGARFIADVIRRPPSGRS
jgi:hypothetical protein